MKKLYLPFLGMLIMSAYSVSMASDIPPLAISNPITMSFNNYTTYPINIGLRNFTPMRTSGNQIGISDIAINGTKLAGTNTAMLPAVVGSTPGELQLSGNFMQEPLSHGSNLNPYEYEHTKISLYEWKNRCIGFSNQCIVPGSSQLANIIPSKTSYNVKASLDDIAARLDIIFNSGPNYSQFTISGITTPSSGIAGSFPGVYHTFNGFLNSANTFYSFDHKQEITICATVTFNSGKTLTTVDTSPSTLNLDGGSVKQFAGDPPKSYTFNIYPYAQAQCAKYYPYQDGSNSNTNATPNQNDINN